MIIWCDTETTGLDESNDLLLEVAIVVTDDELKERAAASWIINHGMKSVDIPMKLVVREMHERSGLLRDIDAGLGSPEVGMAACLIEIWLRETFGSLADLKQLPLAGSTIGFDRKFLRKNMKDIEALFNHRSIDVSSITECASRWNRPVYAARPKQDRHVPHRALDDARNSVEYLRYYRQNFLKEDTSWRVTGGGEQ